MGVIDVLDIRIFAIDTNLLLFALGPITLLPNWYKIDFIAVDSGLTEHDPQVIVIISHVDYKHVKVLSSCLLLENHLGVTLQKHLLSLLGVFSKLVHVETVWFVVSLGGFHVVGFLDFLVFNGFN